MLPGGEGERGGKGERDARRRRNESFSYRVAAGERRDYHAFENRLTSCCPFWIMPTSTSTKPRWFDPCFRASSAGFRTASCGDRVLNKAATTCSAADISTPPSAPQLRAQGIRLYCNKDLNNVGLATTLFHNCNISKNANFLWEFLLHFINMLKIFQVYSSLLAQWLRQTLLR